MYEGVQVHLWAAVSALEEAVDAAPEAWLEREVQHLVEEVHELMDELWGREPTDAA